ncbi:MAG: hypothetical protein AB1609_06760, partial [Bacillota bacterium]
PAGACILYAQSCDLRDRDLADRYDLVTFVSGKSPAFGDEDDDEDEDELEEGYEDWEGTADAKSGSKVRLKQWTQRRAKTLGFDVPGRPAPLIDQVHRLMHLWREGDVRRVDAYLEERGLWSNQVFPRLLQALVELARRDGQADECALLESIMNHIRTASPRPARQGLYQGEFSFPPREGA